MRIVPVEVAQTALGRHGEKFKSSLRLPSLASRDHYEGHTELDIAGSLASYERTNAGKELAQFYQSHPFLGYAAEY